MRTSVQAPLVRSVGAESFAHITSAEVLAIEGEGVLFDGDLTDEQIEDVWWYTTSRDDADQAEREALYVRLGEAVAGTHAAGWQTDVLAELLRYQLGLQQ